MGEGHRPAPSLQDRAHLDFGCITILKIGWPKESKDMDYPLWTTLYMFVVGIANPKDGTLHLVNIYVKDLGYTLNLDIKW